MIEPSKKRIDYAKSKKESSQTILKTHKIKSQRLSWFGIMNRMIGELMLKSMCKWDPFSKKSKED